MAGFITAFGIAGPLTTDAGYLWDKNSFIRLPNAPLTTVASAQSWFIWPGIAMIEFSPFSELGANWNSLYFSFQVVVCESPNITRKLSKKEALAVDAAAPVSKDTTSEHELIPTSCSLYGYFLAFVGLQSTSETDISPTGTVGKVAQLVFSRIPNADIQIAQKTNLICANIAAAACSRTVDMVSDLKTAQLTKASPHAMLGAQMVGSVFAIAIAIPSFLLYAGAYPCILALTGGGSIPAESMIAAIVPALIAVLNVIIRVRFVSDAWKPYWLNMNAFGLGFVSTGVNTPCCMLMGSDAGQLWLSFGKTSHGHLMYSVSAGLISSIGIAGVIKAALTIGKVPDKKVFVGLGSDGELC
ncbi:hypothetical protein BGZ47_000833 [Haplosporangium gracile]|nr:hypothetical protein BGZ47_000833 [Haplosporangium gracile]